MEKKLIRLANKLLLEANKNAVVGCTGYIEDLEKVLKLLSDVRTLKLCKVDI